MVNQKINFILPMEVQISLKFEVLRTATEMQNNVGMT